MQQLTQVSLTTVGNRHLTHTKTIEQFPTIVPHVVDSHSLPIVEADSEPPFLPLDKILVGDGETRALRLDDLQRLEVPPHRHLDQIGMIFILDAVGQRCFGARVMSQTVLLAARGEGVDPYDLVLEDIQDRRYRERKRILVAVRMVVGRAGVKYGLDVFGGF